jgi:hypothetical protein
MINLQFDKTVKLIDCLDTDISLCNSIKEITQFFRVQKSDILSPYSIYHVVVPLKKNTGTHGYEFLIKKI